MSEKDTGGGMNNRENAKHFFDKDVVPHHKMQVLRDDGVYRHLLFKKPGTSSHHFNVVTYPGTLVYTGDMGSFVFQRLDDMFKFFRTDADRGDGINPSYWAEKLVAIDRGGHKEFDENKFNRRVMQHLITWIREIRDSTDKEERRDLWEAVVSDVIEADGDSNGMRKQIAANDFYHPVRFKNSQTKGFSFVDFWEHNFEDYTVQFYWACYAIAWAVKQYDLAKATEVAA
jgi:hypothetical protein